MTGGHPAPAAGCDCGIYAAPDLDTLRQHGLCLSPGGLVVGQVSLWGKVVVAGHGFRCEYAAPRSLAMVEETVPERSRLATLDALATYQVPVCSTSLEQAVGELSGAVLANQVMSMSTGDEPG